MTFEKQLMTISELEQKGFSREDLERWVHIRGFPAMRNGKQGRWRIDTELLIPWLIKKGIMKRPDPELRKIKDAQQPASTSILR